MPSMEPRQRPRQKGPQFPHHELASILYACGDHHTPLPQTVDVLDEIITDYVIEMCHEADLHARTAGRSKVKVDDFQFSLRNDARKLGRIVELLEVNRQIQKKRDMFKNQNAPGAATQLAGTTGNPVQNGVTGAPGDNDDEMQELAELLESGRTKKGKAKALKDSAAAAAAKAAADAKSKTNGADAMEDILAGGLEDEDEEME